MAVSGSQVSVTTSATLLGRGDSSLATTSLTIKNPTGGVTVFLSDASVSTSAFGLDGGMSFSVDLQPGEAIYGIVATGAQVVHVFRSGSS